MIATDWIDLLIIALVPLDTEYTKYTEYTQKKKENIINQWQNYEKLLRLCRQFQFLTYTHRMADVSIRHVKKVRWQTRLQHSRDLISLV